MARISRPQPEPSIPPQRAQLLATEHAGLVAARSTAQSEVLTRITIFLTLFSAGLVSIALIGQVTRFDGLFGPSSITVLSIIAVVGQLTQTRVLAVGMEDLMYVLALNRIRAGVLEVDPGLAKFLMASPHDDLAGAERTYDFFGTRSPATQVGGSSMMLIIIVNAMLLGLLSAAVALTAGAPAWLIFVLGGVVAIGFLVVSLLRGRRRFIRTFATFESVNPSEVRH